MIFAGFPPTITLSGTSLTTIAPAATIEVSPMVTPFPTTALSQIQTLSLSSTLLVDPTGSALLYIPCQSASDT